VKIKRAPNKVKRKVIRRAKVIPLNPQMFVPSTPEAFENIVNDVFHVVKNSDINHVRSVVANRICHLPPDQAMVSADYFAHCVIKSMSYSVAMNQISQMKAEVTVEQLDSVLTTEPGNQQARDDLQKLVDLGNDSAKAVFKKHFPDLPPPVVNSGLKVVSEPPAIPDTSSFDAIS